MEVDTVTSDEVLWPQDEAEGDVKQCESKEVAYAESSLPGPLRREHVTKRLSVLGRNPFTQAHIYTTATLTGLHLSDIETIREFPHIQHLICNQNELQSLAPLQHIRLLLTLDAAENNLTEVLDFEVPKCCPGNAWVDGARWIGSLLRKATLDKNRIVSMPRHELATTHPFLLELRLAHNAIEEISEAPRGLQALETLLLSHNQLLTIDPGVTLLPRLTHLDVAHNQLQTLSSLGDCIRLQRLELAHNCVTDINDLNGLAGLRYLGHLSLDGCPLVEAQVSRVFYRARVLRRLLQLQRLDDEQVTSKEKVKALVMHGSDLEARRRVAAKYLPGQEFADFLPPLDFEGDEQLDLPLRRTPSSYLYPTSRRAAIKQRASGAVTALGEPAADTCPKLHLPALYLESIGCQRRDERCLLQWQELNLEFWGVLVAIVVFVVVSAQLCLVVGWWRSNSGTIIALKARRRLMKRMTIYVHALNATWLVVLVVFFIYRSSASALAYVQVEGVEQVDRGGMNFLDAFFHFVLTAKGFVIGMVWLSVNKPCCALGLVFCGIHQCREDDDGPSLGASASASASSQSASLSGSSNGDVGAPRANQAALLSATVISMEAGILAPQDTPMMSPTSTVLAFEAHESVRESGAVRPQERQSLPALSAVMGPPSTARSSRSSSSSYDASTVESYEASQNNETLQREIIYYTVCGITKAIIRSAERARASSVTRGPDAGAVLEEDGVANSAIRNRDGGAVETTLFVGAERDSTLVNSTFISHVQSVTILSSPRAYCEPRARLPVAARHYSLAGGDDARHRGGNRVQQPRPTSFTATSSLDFAGDWRQPLELQHSRSQGSHSPRSSRMGLTASNIMFRSFHQTPGRFSLYPVSQVPFELFEQEIELQSTRSSVDTEQPVEGKSTRSAVFAGLRRTASSAFNQGRGVFRNRSGSTEAAAGAPSTSSAIGREFLPDDPKPKVFVDYAPREFRAIRLAFGLSDEKYLASFRTTAKERVSSGSSGAFMFFSGDNSLLVKSLKEKECRALVDMAPEYARYLTANPHSRLIRFFGCHRVRLYGRNFYFAVMSNVLHSEQHTATITEKYDVKGSWVDRRARRPQRGDRVTCAECDATYIFGGSNENDISGAAVDTDDGRTSVLDGTVPQFPFHVHRPDIVFKDLDLARSLHLPRDVAAHLNKQLISDGEFLRDVGIMDYSLLIGIHKCHLRAPRPSGFGTASDFDEAFDREVNLEESTSGVNLSPLGGEEVYFVGIIDILQQWDWEKQLEKAGKVLLGKSARGISAVAPAPYCRRFQARCSQILEGGPAPEDMDLDWEVDPNAASVKETKSRPNSKKIKEMALTSLVDDKA
ncbi:hypothetical protein PF004_g20402 [Phytophthora fragariae]|uniref:PIPK domain-containing protein n=1 Tax=Phytophthora fragariae TaxID=53985 RepID=A0A6G0N6P7_9STRA|nr:hypothetical protein PF004_g20402 [Phytophthora fragariae]